MATAKKNTALALVDSFQVVGRYEGLSPEVLAELKDEMEDLDPETGIACRQVKVPSGGGIAYEIQGEDAERLLAGGLRLGEGGQGQDPRLLQHGRQDRTQYGDRGAPRLRGLPLE